MVDSDNQKRRNRSLPHQPIHRFLDVPWHTAERARRIEEVLPVVQLQDGVRRRAGLSAPPRAQYRDAPRRLQIAALDDVNVQEVDATRYGG